MLDAKCDQARSSFVRLLVCAVARVCGCSRVLFLTLPFSQRRAFESGVVGLQAQERYEEALRVDPGYSEARANLAAVHRVRSAFVELVKLHQEASLDMKLSADQGGLVVAGYRTAGDGLGSHASHLVPKLQGLTSCDVVMLDTADVQSQIAVDGKRVLVVVEVRHHLCHPVAYGRMYLTLCIWVPLPSWSLAALQTGAAEGRAGVSGLPNAV